ncbi:MAG: PTS sugar transporter subunit IIA [Planctomycetota bacterium]|nr:PTS sugar transporter subunit IIA [Planctomycetota bacterium]
MVFLLGGPFRHPDVILDANPLLTLSVVLVAGVGFGTLAKRFHLPAVTGQILVGILIGPAVIGVFRGETIHDLEPVIDFALGLMAVDVGSHLALRRLGNAKRRLALLLAFEAALTPALVFAGVFLLSGGMSWYMSNLLAAIAISTAPATILAIVKETRSKGVFVKTLVAAVALNNLVCILAFELAHTVARVSVVGGSEGFASILMVPLKQLVLSALLACGTGLALVAATRRIVRPDRLTAVSIIAILLTIGLAQHLEISVLLSCLFLGVLLANVTPDKEEIGHEVFENFEYAIYAVFFTVAGMELQFRYLIPAGVVALAMFLGRFVGKVAAASIAMKVAGATDRIRKHLGVALIPQAGLAVGLMLLVTEDPAFAANAAVRAERDTFLAVVLTVVLFNELIGPILTRRALVRSGDFGKDRARLIDFLHEEHIVCGLQAEHKEQAIEQLVDHLIRTHDQPIERDAFLEAVLERERMASTCLGDGLAMPHAELEEGEAIVGVMGISRHGLDFDAPDGHPVHCMVLLATPSSQRAHHLEVLAAFARAIGHTRNIRQQLYQADSSAHAYELLHADEESEDFNYFLEEDE